MFQFRKPKSDKPQAMSDPFVDQLTRALAILDEWSQGLTSRAVKFVLTGKDPKVLNVVDGITASELPNWELERWGSNHNALYERVYYGHRHRHLVDDELQSLAHLFHPSDDKEEWNPAVFQRIGQLYSTRYPQNWLNVLFHLASESFELTEYSSRTRSPFHLFRVDRIREMLDLSSSDETLLLDQLFRYTRWGWASDIDEIPAADTWIKDHATTVSDYADQIEPQYQINFISEIDRLGLTEHFIPLLLRLAHSDDKSTKATAILAARSLPRRIQSQTLKQVLVETPPNERTETRARVTTTKCETLRDNNTPIAMLDDTRRSHPSPLQQLPDRRLTDTEFDALWNTAEISNHAVRSKQEEVVRAGRQRRREESHIRLDLNSLAYELIKKSEVPAFIKCINALPVLRDRDHYEFYTLAALLIQENRTPCDTSGLDTFFFNPKLPFPKLVRAIAVVQRGIRGSQPMFPWLENAGDITAVRALMHRLTELGDLRYLTREWRRATGIEPLLDYLNPGSDCYGLDDLPVPGLDDYVLENLDLIDQGIGLQPQSEEIQIDLESTLDVLSRLDVVPQRYQGALMDLAIGGYKLRRTLARRMLDVVPGLNADIAARLSDGKPQQRMHCAAWLAERGAKEQADAVHRALRKEKSIPVRGVLMATLKRLGADLTPYFDADTLSMEADKGLNKANTDKLDWLSQDALPECRWADGSRVDPRLVWWWVVLAVKLKQPGGNGLFDLYLEQLDPDDAARLGLYLFHAWIAYDTAHPDEQACNAYAEQQADRALQTLLYWEHTAIGATREGCFEKLKREKQREYLNSAAATKGLLALTPLAPDAEFSRAAQTYLKNESARVAQCKAVVEALAHDPGPLALQVLLATSGRFKSRSVQALARERVESLAEQRGWTTDQLADRLIPSAGMNDSGVLQLDCGGGRIYSAKLIDDGTLQLRNPAGKPVKTLPAARAQDDEETLKAARKEFSAAKKQLKQVVTMQTARLELAMCTERSWAVDDWQRYLGAHPIVGRLCRGLVWLAQDADGNTVTSFRPLNDGSLTDAEDNPVDLSGATHIKLAHRALVSKTLRDAWAAHLQDYEVEPLFEQFRRPLLTELDDDDATRIEDRRGWLTETFKLRKAATGRGFQRGEVTDGGGFDEYCKPFEAVGVVAVVGFSGSSVPEESADCALYQLSFHKLRGKSHGRLALPLATLPPVLLSEAWNDYHEMAATSDGERVDW